MLSTFGPPHLNIYSHRPDRYINYTICHYTPVNCNLLFMSKKEMDINQSSTVFNQFNSKFCIKQILLKKIVHRAAVKKFLHRQWAKKKFLQAKNPPRHPPPPPPFPHQVSNGPSLNKKLIVTSGGSISEKIWCGLGPLPWIRH